MSLVTVVVEAAARSGARITANLAADAGREVMVVPGPVTSRSSEGCHALLSQGAPRVHRLGATFWPICPPTLNARR